MKNCGKDILSIFKIKNKYIFIDLSHKSRLFHENFMYQYIEHACIILYNTRYYSIIL